jgi:thiol:disulfide interchange protein
MLSALLSLTVLAWPAFASHAATKPPPSGIVFLEDDYPSALAKAKAEKKPLFLDSWATWCHSCRRCAPSSSRTRACAR